MDDEKLKRIEFGMNSLIWNGTIPLGGGMFIDRDVSTDERLVVLIGQAAVDYARKHCEIGEAVLKALKLPHTAGPNEVQAKLNVLLGERVALEEALKGPQMVQTECNHCSWRGNVDVDRFNAGRFFSDLPICPMCKSYLEKP